MRAGRRRASRHEKRAARSSLRRLFRLRWSGENPGLRFSAVSMIFSKLRSHLSGRAEKRTLCSCNCKRFIISTGRNRGKEKGFVRMMLIDTYSFTGTTFSFPKSDCIPHTSKPRNESPLLLADTAEEKLRCSFPLTYQCATSTKTQMSNRRTAAPYSK